MRHPLILLVDETQGGEDRWREVNLCRQSGKSRMTFGSGSNGYSMSMTLQRLRVALALMRAGCLTVLSSAFALVANGITSQKSTATLTTTTWRLKKRLEEPVLDGISLVGFQLL